MALTYIHPSFHRQGRLDPDRLCVCVYVRWTATCIHNVRSYLPPVRKARLHQGLKYVAGYLTIRRIPYPQELREHHYYLNT